jgi:hypothetical protein
MSITNGYATLDDVKGYLDISDSDDDTRLEQAITATSRAIDDLCLRRFYATTETRYFTPGDSYRLPVSDLLSITTLQSDEDGDLDYDCTWAETDYLLSPANAAADGWPYLAVEAHPAGNYRFPQLRRAVKITGSWGFAATTPDTVHEACLLASAQVFKRKDAIYGVMGGAGFLQNVKNILRSDPLIMGLLAPYMKRL